MPGKEFCHQEGSAMVISSGILELSQQEKEFERSKYYH